MSRSDNSDDSKGKSQGAVNHTRSLHLTPKSEYAPVHISGLTPERTETIDLKSLFSTDVTSSGSFDLRRVGLESFSKLLQVLSTPTLLVDHSHTIEFANRAFISMTGGLEPFGYEFARVFSNPKQARVFGMLLERVFAARRPEVREGRLQLQNAEIWGRVHLRTIRLGGDQMVLIQIENLTAQKELVTIQKYKKLVDIFPIGIAEFALISPLSDDLPLGKRLGKILEARLIDGNDEFAKMYERGSIKELIQVPLGRLLPAESGMRDLYERWIKRGYAPFSFEARETGLKSAAKRFEYTLIGNPKDRELIGLWWLKRDISEKKRMEEEILKAQKLESLGVLAGGIAHDFNNLLTAMLGNISLGKANSNLSETSIQRFEAAAKAGKRAQDLTHQLLTFSKGGAPVKSPSSISQLLRDCASFAVQGSNVLCELHVPESLWSVEMDEGQISQVVNNLVINALQAMPSGGSVLIRAKNVSVGKDQLLRLKEGKYVRVSVADHGEGISPANMPKIFDPYFTTKKTGTGLGLATSYSIIKKHGGLLAVRSKVGVGTMFYFFLPAAVTKSLSTDATLIEPIKGRGRVLIMDDEEMIREMAEDLIRELGYEVTLAKDGMEAVDIYQRAFHEGRQFDAVILDLTVPGGMGGAQTLAELSKIDPDVKAIVSSGYYGDPIMSDYAAHGFKAVLPKPYDIKRLSQGLAMVILPDDELGTHK
jgi:two-component system, cell cycle sensor histidine kinase and response regulator CckA